MAVFFYCAWADFLFKFFRFFFYSICNYLFFFEFYYLNFRYCYAPFGIYLGIKNVKPKKVVSIPELEKLYQSGKKVVGKEIKYTANQLKMTERQVERWLRVRRAMDKPTTLKKFCENSFRCTYYIYSFTYGLIVLWDKPWLWNINYCWYGYPHQVGEETSSPPFINTFVRLLSK